MSVSLFYPRRFGLPRHRIFPACAACPAAVHFSVTPGAAPVRPRPAPVNGRGSFASPRTGYSLQPVAVSRRACRRALSISPCTGRAGIGLSIPSATLRPGTQPSATAAAVSARNGRTLRGARSFGPGARR